MIDAWSGPPPTPQQFPANEPNGIRKLLDKIKALELQIRESTSNLLGTAGIRLTQLGMFIDSSLTVGGSLDVTGPMVVGGTADFSGDTSIGGNAAITGTLSLPAGIIGNDALTSPLASTSIYATTDTYVVTTTETTRASVTVTVPAGFTAAVVSVMARVDGRNSNTTGGWDAAGGDLLHTRAWIGGVPGIDMDLSVLGSGDHAVSVMPFSQPLPGLTPGDTFVLAAKVWSEYQNWAAHAKNIAEISGTVTWYR